MRPALSAATVDALSRALAGVEGTGASAPADPDLERGRRKQGEKEERRGKVATSGRAPASRPVR
jgi:hypothetical protein